MKALTPSQLKTHHLAAIARLDNASQAPIALKHQGSWPATNYLLDVQSADALIAAMAAGKPLLIRGEPGVGKSQLARAAAAVLERPFMVEVVQPDSEYTDLLWRIDHTKRLADAQLAGAQCQTSQTNATHDVNNIGHYIGPGALWWAIDAGGAEAQHVSGAANYLPDAGLDAEQCQQQGVVLLIDEVDKADISLTNGLLEVLGNGSFSVPPLGQTVATVGPPPLVVLTSNNTRELPAALLRRCVVLTLRLGEDVQAHLMKIGATVFPSLSAELRQQAAVQIVEDRDRCLDGPKTGLAEYLDLLSALEDLSGGPISAEQWLTRLGRFFKKSQVSQL